MRVGILGGGQLGTMIASAVARLGGTPLVYEPDPDAPAHRQVPEHVVAPFDDRPALGSFLSRCDVVTVDREDLPLDALREARGRAPFVPDLATLAIAQDRAQEKAFFVEHALPCVRHRAVEASVSLERASETFGCPAIAKTLRGGYDGKGQYVLCGASDARSAALAHPGAAWLLEERVPLLAEASCIVARAGEEEVAFPVVDNVHRQHVLDRSVLPSGLPDETQELIQRLALSAARALDLRGLLAVEFFVVQGAGESHAVLLNEIAPRPHNSGHLLSRACTFGQFEALARLLLGAPIGAPRLLPGAHCMGNLLGEIWIAQGKTRDAALDLAGWRAFPDVVDVHLYGKTRPEPRRKMGHFVACAPRREQALARAEAFRRELAKVDLQDAQGALEAR